MFSNKRLELLSKYVADISKLFFAGGVLKEMLRETFDFGHLLVGFLLSVLLLTSAFFLQPRE
ncbi:MAG: DUF6722 family protein [Candidatus Latescibacterota bacterium]